MVTLFVLEKSIHFLLNASFLFRERKSFETYQANYKKAFEELQNEKVFEVIFTVL